jgi:hypothetical protein
MILASADAVDPEVARSDDVLALTPADVHGTGAHGGAA